MSKEVTEVATKKIKIIVAEKQTKDGNKKFNTYKTVTKNGRLIDVKFRKEVKNLPEGTCFAEILVDNMNIDKTRQYPVLWVSAVEGYTSISEDHTEKNRKDIEDFFGE